MSTRLHSLPRDLMATPLLAGLAVGAWAAWLGWDQVLDVAPDGSVSGPYQAWQVIGLVLTLTAVVWASARRQLVVASIIGTTAGLTVASFYDWSDDGSGLFVIGVGMTTMATFAATAGLTVITASRARRATA
ncbi:hypothetical protein [Streptomyces sp. NPDC101132]|uniref:hypothetical protein n=1 Tax=Streptomyces sp. NPDC101132 TaxID=3366110 RepID=UPI0038181F2E